MANEIEIKWLTDADEDDYPAAASYLSLLYDEQAAAKYVEQLRKAPVSEFKAKDIFRASNLSLLGVSNSHVDHDQKKILAGKSLSPLLLVCHLSRDRTGDCAQALAGFPLDVHRSVCASSPAGKDLPIKFFLIQRVVFPTTKQDTNPFEREGPDCCVSRFAFGSLSSVIGSGPRGGSTAASPFGWLRILCAASCPTRYARKGA